MEGLTGKTIVVTGAARGQGAAEAAALARAGADVVAADILEQEGGGARAQPRRGAGVCHLPAARCLRARRLAGARGIACRPRDAVARAREQRRDRAPCPHRRGDPGRLESDAGRQPHGRAARDPDVRAFHDLGWVDRQRRLGCGAHRLPLGRLHGEQVGAARAVSRGGARVRASRHPRQPRQSRIHRDGDTGRCAARVPAGLARPDPGRAAGTPDEVASLVIFLLSTPPHTSAPGSQHHDADRTHRRERRRSVRQCAPAVTATAGTARETSRWPDGRTASRRGLGVFAGEVVPRVGRVLPSRARRGVGGDCRSG